MVSITLKIKSKQITLGLLKLNMIQSHSIPLSPLPIRLQAYRPCVVSLICQAHCYPRTLY